ncbi:unnamed protein product [Staurois parvus]|uniref:Uncharacterized protein n=1 Tax=Staurois parvus TaxID=386267 RepID=A0ABN9GYR4_9NEOB|nr:unnamed protein product [Staurois parvus]
MHQAAAVIKRAWKKWKEKLEALAAVELDDILEMENTQSLSGSPAKVLNTSITNSMQDNPLITNEVVQSWNLGFVLSRAPPIRKIVIADGFHRHWYLLACLNVLNRNKGYKAEFIQSEHGIASIRALPQVIMLHSFIRFIYYFFPCFILKGSFCLNQKWAPT